MCAQGFGQQAKEGRRTHVLRVRAEQIGWCWWGRARLCHSTALIWFLFGFVLHATFHPAIDKMLSIPLVSPRTLHSLSVSLSHTHTHMPPTHSLTPDGKKDPSSLHGSCPVFKGEKWSATKWIHVAPFGGPPPPKPADPNGCDDTHPQCAEVG